MPKITYTINFNLAKASQAPCWEVWYEKLSEDDARLVAVTSSNMKLERFNKLVNHSSKKFLHMRTAKVWVEKVLHKEEVECVPALKQLKEMVNKLVEKC